MQSVCNTAVRWSKRHVVSWTQLMCLRNSLTMTVHMSPQSISFSASNSWLGRGKMFDERATAYPRRALTSGHYYLIYHILSSFSNATDMTQFIHLTRELRPAKLSQQNWQFNSDVINIYHNFVFSRMTVYISIYIINRNNCIHLYDMVDPKIFKFMHIWYIIHYLYNISWSEQNCFV